MKSQNKVLIISHNSFSKVYNNGKTLEALFSHFEKNKLAQLYFSQNENPDFDYCEKYFQITDRNILDRILHFSSKCGDVVENHYIVDKNNDKLFTFAKKRSKYLMFLRDILWKTNLWKTKRLYQWCNDFNPDVIFYVGGNQGFSHSIARYISRILKKPLITYFTDDYLIFPKNRNIIEKIQWWRMNRFYKKTINQSSLLFTIGELMSKEYSKYFNKEFFPIMNSVPIVSYTSYQSKEKITISYFGGIHLDRWKMIVKLAKAMENVDFNVYTIVKPSHEVIRAFQSVGVTYKGGIRGDDLQKEILNSDILLHVESDDNYYRSLTRLSVSTKIPEYLMSGRVILGFGPPEVASMRLLSDNNIGVVVPSTITDLELKKMMNEIVSDYKMRYNIGLKGYNYAVKNFNNIEIIDVFTSKIESIIISNV